MNTKNGIKKVLVFVIILLMIQLAVATTFYYDENSAVVIRNSSNWNDYSTTVMNFVNQNPDPVSPGSYVEVRWKIENIGGKASAANFLFEINPEYPFSLDKGASATRELGKIDSYQTGKDAYVIFYKLKVDEAAVEGSNRIKIKSSADNGGTWKENTFYIQVEEQDFAISVDPITTIPEEVKPGDDVNVKIGIQNLASSYIKNVKIGLTVEKVDTTSATITRTELPFTPIGSSDEKVFTLIRPKEKKYVDFKLAVDADAESKVHKIPVTITYSDKQGTEYTKEVNIGIKVFEEPNYLLNLEDTEIYKNKQKGSVIASISNIGFGNIKFLTVKLNPSDDYQIIGKDTIYLGNLESDDYETASFDIYVDSENKEVPLNLEIRYKDSYNKDYVVRNSDLVIKNYDTSEAILLGLENQKGKGKIIFSLMIGAIFTIFWLSMLLDAVKSHHTGYKKILWIALILFAFVLGALIYYIGGRKKKTGA